MLETSYAQALWKMAEKGTDPKKAVSSLSESLKKNGRAELMPRILRAFKRLAQLEEKGKRARIWVARDKDAHSAMKASGAGEADVCVDESLIGGWRLEKGETLIDASFKKMLLDMYNRAIS